MERVFTKDTGRYKRGESRDYPKSVWENIARSNRKALDAFSQPADRFAENATRKTRA